MGPLLAVLVALALNLAPPAAASVTVVDHPKPGTVGEPVAYVLNRAEDVDDTWVMHDATGRPWFLVRASGSVLHLSDPDSDVSEDLDLMAALGMEDPEWWLAERVEAAGAEPLVLSHLPNGVDVALVGQLVGEVRY